MKTFKSFYKISILMMGLMLFIVSVANANTFYSKGSIAPNTRTNWTSSPSGSGGSSPTTTQWGQSSHTYIVRRGNAMTTSAAWNLPSSLQIVAGGSLTVGTNNSYTLTIGGTTDISGTLTLKNTSNKIFTGDVTVNSGGILDIQSTSLNVHASNDLTVAAGGTLNHHANYDNASCLLEIYGSLSIDGTYNYSSSAPAIFMNGVGTKYINTGTTSLFKLFLRTGEYKANGPVTVDQEFFAMWNQAGGSFHTNGQIVNANWGVVNSGGTFYVDGGTLNVGNTVGGMLIGRTASLDGDLRISAGTIKISGAGIYLGTELLATPKGNCTQTGGTINVGILDIGQNSTFTQSGGTNNVNGNLNLNYSSAVYNQTATSNLNVAGTFTNKGVYNSTGTGLAALNIAGGFTNNKTFTATSTSTVIFNGSAEGFLNGSATTNFYNLVIDKSDTSKGVTSSGAAFKVNNDLTVNSGHLSLQASDADYTFTKNVTVGSDGTLTHSVSWDSYGKKISIGGNLMVTGIINSTVRSHVQLNGSGAHTLQTGNNPASALNILTLQNGDFTASGTLKSNAEAWVMFGTSGSFTTNGEDVTLGSLLCNNGTINMNLGGTLTVNGGTQIDYGGGGAMNISAGTVNLNGPLTISPLGTITCTNAPQINITGNWSNSKTFTPAGSTVSFLGAANQTIGGAIGTSFNNLIINPSAGITVSSVSNNISILNNLTVSTGIFDLQTFTCNRAATGGMLSLASGTLLKAAGANNFPQSFSTYTLNANSTTEYYGTVPQSVYPTTYGHLTMSNNSTKTAAGIVNIAGNLNINSSAIFAGVSYAHTIKGQWNNNVSASAYTGGTSTFTFNGTALQTIGGTAPTAFNNLTIDNSANINISQDQTVISTLTLTAGRLNIGTKNFTLSAFATAVAGSPFSSSKMIVADGGGEVRKNYVAKVSFLFPIGDVTGTAEYSPITLNYTAGSFAVGAYAGVKVTNAKHPNNASSTNFLTRYWTVSNSGISSPSFTATGKYLAADIGGTEATIAAAKYTGALPWVKYGVIGSNTLTTTAITNSGAGIIVSGITNQVPAGSITGGGIAICLGNSASLSSLVTNNGTGSVSYAWSPATELSATNIYNPVSTPTVNRTYSLIVIDGNGIKSSAVNSTISVTTPPSATVAYNGAPFCFNAGTTSITRSGSAGGTYSAPTGISLDASSGVINLAASTPGVYSVSYNIAAAGGCPSYSVPTEIKINPNAWTGATSTDWSTGSNWVAAHESGCPDITILSGGYAPIITSGTKIIQNLIIKPGAIFTLNNTAKLQVSGTISNSGIFDAADGTIEMNGTSAQSIAANTFKDNALKNLIISNSNGSGVTLSGALDISGSLTYTGTGKLFTTNDKLTLKSNASTTAWVGDMTGNTINGKVTVERYISAQKAWRFIAIPTSGSQTIKNAWQEGAIDQIADPTPGYGIQLSGEMANWSAMGFDKKSMSPSIKYYDVTSGNWIGVANTNATAINNTKGYMVFVRGDRLSTETNSPVTKTNLRSKDNLITGTQPVINVLPGKFESVGNPYASPVDFTKITKGDSISKVFYLWDPFLRGDYNAGGYQTFTAATFWVPVPGGTTSHPTGVASTTIQNGEAFFVHGNATGDSSDFTLQFTESAKVGSNPPVFARPNGSVNINKRQILKTSLLNTNGQILDGNAVAFDEIFCNAVNGDDALKFANAGENFGLKRFGKSLSVEARNTINTNDTIYYSISNMQKQDYRLQIVPVQMSAGLKGYLIDNYKKSSTEISLSESNLITFTVNNESLSFAADRFKIVLSPTIALPVTFTTINATLNNADAIISWQVSNEVNIKEYQVERSVDGTNFTVIASLGYDSHLGGHYESIDKQPLSGWNYYRIKNVDIDGKNSYSSIAKVYNGKISASINAFPNPVVDNNLFIRFDNQPEGEYTIQLLNSAGQQIKVLKSSVAGLSKTIKMKWDNKLPGGIYTLKISSEVSDSKVIMIKY